MLQHKPSTANAGPLPWDFHRDCFDEALAEYPTRTLPIDQVIDLLQVSHLPERIEEYRGAMLRGDRFPPVSVVEIAGRFFVADGHKRFIAYTGLPVTEVVVEVWTTRRWLADQWRQFASKIGQMSLLATRSLVDSTARAQAVRLFWDTLGHWRRIALSLKGRLASRRTLSGSISTRGRRKKGARSLQLMSSGDQRLTR